MKKKESVDYHIKVCWHAISRMYNQQAAQYDITTSIGFVLLNIDPAEGTPATKIAPLMGLEARSLTRILKTMEVKGLLYREQDTKDRRSVRIFLTKDGLKKRDVSRETVKTFNRAVRDLVAERKLKAFFEVINQINQLIEQNQIYQPSGE